MAGEGWRDVTVEDLKAPTENALATGPFGSSISSRYFQKYGVPVIRGSNLSEEVGTRLNDDGLVFVSDEKAAEFKRSIVRKGDLVFTCWGTINQVGLIDNRAKYSEYIISNKQMKLTPDPSKADSLFLYYLFSGPQMQDMIKNQGIGSSVPGFNLGQLRTMRLRVPQLDEQRAIACILGTLDDKIELNRWMNETLEGMARAIFQSWFVDFDPVSAKIEGRPPGLPDEIADLFPDRFEDSELGEIPAGWKVASLQTHFEAVKGVSYKGSGLSDTGMPLHNLNSVYEGGGYKYEGIKYYNGEYAQRHLVIPGDVIVANTEQGHDRLLIGYAAIVPSAFAARGIASHHIYRLRPRTTSWLSAPFLCQLLNSPKMHDLVSGYANGTTVNMLPIDAVQKPQLVVPPATVVSAFDRFARCGLARSEGVVSESHTLTAIREALLPKLISGELRVTDTERFLAEARA
jgi:type I restriction enzyme S subunit